MTIFDFVKRERETGRWCCISLSSDFNYIWMLEMTEDPYYKLNTQEAMESKISHERSIYVQFEDEEDGLIKAEEALKSFNETGKKIEIY